MRELLRDLGWLPADLNCEEKRRLAEEYCDATAAWTEACRGPWAVLMERLRRSYRPLRGYDAADRLLIEEAQRKAARAKLALEAHIAAHNC